MTARRGERPSGAAMGVAAFAIGARRASRSISSIRETPPTVWREPAAETSEYPGFTVADNRVSGSITLGQSRLPIWCFSWVEFPEWDSYGSDSAEPGAPHYGVTKEAMRGFIHDLFEQRGEFARLLCVLANGERIDRTTYNGMGAAWWERPHLRKRVADQLRRCLAVLGESR